MDRRELLRALGWSAVGAGLGACGLALGGGQGCGLEQPLPVVLGELHEFPRDTVREFPEHALAVIRRERGLQIVSTRCTHLGCSVRLSGQEWRCPCHGGRFALDGALLGGPPPTPLAWLRGAVSGEGLVQVFPTIPNPDRTLVPEQAPTAANDTVGHAASLLLDGPQVHGRRRSLPGLGLARLATAHALVLGRVALSR